MSQIEYPEPPDGALRDLERREQAATDRLAFLGEWADAFHREFDFFARHLGAEHDDAYDMTNSAWRFVRAEFDKAEAEVAWIDAQRTVLDGAGE